MDCLYHFKRKKGRPALYRIALLLGAWGIFIQPYISWLAFVYVAAAVIEKQVKFPEEIAFDDEEVVINSFQKRDMAGMLLKTLF